MCILLACVHSLSAAPCSPEPCCCTENAGVGARLDGPRQRVFSEILETLRIELIPLGLQAQQVVRLVLHTQLHLLYLALVVVPQAALALSGHGSPHPGCLCYLECKVYELCGPALPWPALPWPCWNDVMPQPPQLPRSQTLAQLHQSLPAPHLKQAWHGVSAGQLHQPGTPHAGTTLALCARKPSPASLPLAFQLCCHGTAWISLSFGRWEGPQTHQPAFSMWQQRFNCCSSAELLVQGTEAQALSAATTPFRDLSPTWKVRLRWVWC